MKILVIGGTGTVGSLVVKELSARDVEISVLTRNPEKMKALPKGVRCKTSARSGACSAAWTGCSC
jgi:uncharacterized protein YbjT (DUF2867 family)